MLDLCVTKFVTYKENLSMTSKTENECPMCGEPVVSESDDDGEHVDFYCTSGSCTFEVTL